MIEPVNLPVFDPPVLPSPGTSIKTEAKILTAEFGDGYTQIARDGLNPLRKKVSLAWEALTDWQADQIIEFFEARGGAEPFWFKPTHARHMSKWTCPQWEDVLGKNGLRRISTELVPSFTLEV